MRKLAVIAATAMIAMAGPAFAEDVTKGSVLGKTIQEVEASLTKMGYEVRKSEMEDGKIEVYFVRDGEMGEVYVDPKTGAVIRLKQRS